MNRFEGKNILFIYYKFPPIKGIGTLRNVKFYHSLKQVARKVFVATTANRRFLPRDEFEYDEKDVVEIPTWDFRTIYHWVTGEQGSLLVSRDRSPQKWLPRWKEQFKKSIVARYFDEGGAWFVHQGFRHCSKIIEREKIDIVVSSYLPYDAHKLAFQLKTRYPHLYWIADYRDFFSDPMLRSSPGFSHRQDRHVRVLSLVDEVTTVSQGLKNRLDPFHSNVHVVRNGIQESLTDWHPMPRYNLFTLSYTGSIYPVAQNGELVARALRDLVDEGKLHKIHLQFINAGKDGLYWKRLLEKYHLGDLLVNYGIVPHRDSLAIQKKSHLNILLSWASTEVSGILTGKLFEYLSAGTPIIAVINGQFDPELHELIAETAHGELFYDSDIGLDNLKNFIYRHYLAWQNGHSYLPKLNEFAFDEWSRGVITWQNEFRSWAQDVHSAERGQSGIGGSGW